MTRSEFALAVMKAVYGADKDTDFLARGQADGLLPQVLTLDATVMPRGEASLLLDTALTTMSTSNIHGHMPPCAPSGFAIEVGGADVAIVGLTDDGSKATTHFSNTQDIGFHDQWEACQDVAAQADAESLSRVSFRRVRCTVDTPVFYEKSVAFLPRAG
ncbi:hypothetical protein [uncultured Intestinimonas sp.]|uniref:hypothetical protein n=1 Tax=uncultured Intestinimonas sp. TaxID=1689265 RepID=UPI0025D6F01F|nr:hypothetical protein [uncultured Intestinimonas sp.]